MYKRQDKNFQGEVVFSPGYTVGYLEQEPHLDDTKTVREVVEEGCADVVALLKEYEQVNARFMEPMDDEQIDVYKRQAWGRTFRSLLCPKGALYFLIKSSPDEAAAPRKRNGSRIFPLLYSISFAYLCNLHEIHRQKTYGGRKNYILDGGGQHCLLYTSLCSAPYR